MLILEIRSSKTKKLLFQYDPINEEIWIKHKNGELERISLYAVKGANFGKIQAYMSTLSTEGSEYLRVPGENQCPEPQSGS